MGIVFFLILIIIGLVVVIYRLHLNMEMLKDKAKSVKKVPLPVSNNSEQKINKENVIIIEKLKSENKELNSKIDILNRKNDELLQKEKVLESNVEELKQKNSEFLKERTEKKSDNTDNVEKNGEFERIYKKFNEISEDEKEKIELILNNKKGKEVFLALGSQSANLKLLWEKIEFNIQKGRNPEDTEKMKEVYYYFFNLYNLLYSEPVYFLLEDDVNEKYNPITTIPINNSANGEIVKKVVFKGYRNRKGDIIKKSLVILG